MPEGGCEGGMQGRDAWGGWVCVNTVCLYQEVWQGGRGHGQIGGEHKAADQGAKEGCKREMRRRGVADVTMGQLEVSIRWQNGAL